MPLPRGVACHGGRWGILMERCTGPSLADRMRAPGGAPAGSIAVMVGLHRRIHALDGAGLPAQHSRLACQIGQAAALDRAERKALLDRLAALDSGAERLCHGDFHPGNFLGPPEAPLIIDWVDASAGTPQADACRSYLLLSTVSADLATSYLDAYAGPSAAGREAVLARLPVIAGARLAEGFAAETAVPLPLARRAAA